MCVTLASVLGVPPLFVSLVDGLKQTMEPFC